MATLLVALVILGILTIVVLYSTHVAFFEQRTATNENRSRLVEQAAEYSINLAGEYLKANRDYVISRTTGTNVPLRARSTNSSNVVCFTH